MTGVCQVEESVDRKNLVRERRDKHVEKIVLVFDDPSEFREILEKVSIIFEVHEDRQENVEKEETEQDFA